MYFVYVLKSLKDGRLYIGYSSNLKQRYLEHQGGLVKSTRGRRPLKLIYYQAFLSEKDARTEERHLKSA